MFVDLQINSTGDIVFHKEDKQYKALKVKFCLSQTKVQKVSFHMEDSFFKKETKDNLLKVSFFINKEKDAYAVTSLKDDDVYIQMINLKLKTVLGELPQRPSFGSTLTTVKHMNINDKSLKQVELIVKDSLKDIVRDPVVKVVPYINYKNGYEQSIKINIYNDTNLLLEYIVER